MKQFTQLLLSVLSSALIILGTTSLGATPQTHDGFMLRLLAGAGNAGLNYRSPNSASVNDFTFESKSTSPYISLQFGKAPVENFIIHLNTFYIQSPERKPKVESPLPELKKVKLTQKYFSYGFAFGMTYYLPRGNFYISPEFRPAVYAQLEEKIKSTNSGQTMTMNLYRSRFEGQGLGITLGQEFWTNDNVGIGYALFYNVDWLTFKRHQEWNASKGGYVTFPERSLDTGSATQFIIGAGLSITYN